MPAPRFTRATLDEMKEIFELLDDDDEPMPNKSPAKKKKEDY